MPDPSGADGRAVYGLARVYFEPPLKTRLSGSKRSVD